MGRTERGERTEISIRKSNNNLFSCTRRSVSCSISEARDQSLTMQRQNLGVDDVTLRHTKEGRNILYMQKISKEGVDDLACTKPEAKIVTEQI